MIRSIKFAGIAKTLRETPVLLNKKSVSTDNIDS